MVQDKFKRPDLNFITLKCQEWAVFQFFIINLNNYISSKTNISGKNNMRSYIYSIVLKNRQGFFYLVQTWWMK